MGYSEHSYNGHLSKINTYVMDKQSAPDIVNNIGKVYEIAWVFCPNKHMIT